MWDELKGYTWNKSNPLGGLDKDKIHNLEEMLKEIFAQVNPPTPLEVLAKRINEIDSK